MTITPWPDIRSDIGYLEVYEYAFCDDDCECVGLALGVVGEIWNWAWDKGHPRSYSTVLDKSDWLGSTGQDYDRIGEFRNGKEYQCELKRLLTYRMLILAVVARA